MNKSRRLESQASASSDQMNEPIYRQNFDDDSIIERESSVED